MNLNDLNEYKHYERNEDVYAGFFCMIGETYLEIFGQRNLLQGEQCLTLLEK